MMSFVNDDNQNLPSVNGATNPMVGRQLPFLVLSVTLIITAVAWWQTAQHFENLAHERFSNRIDQIQSKIKARMLQYEQVLRSGVALHDSSSLVTRAEWKTFVDRCEVDQWFPGIQAMGFAVPVPKPELSAFEAEIRSEGFSDFQIRPTYARDRYTAIKYIEPFDWRNKRAFGYDMYSNPARRKAMDRAALTGLPSISGKITLVQETDKDVQAGILCYLPLYQPNASLTTSAERQRALRGWVYAAFRCDDLMKGIVGENAKELHLEIYDTRDTTPEQILFDSRSGELGVGGTEISARQEPLLTQVVPIELAGRDWTLKVSSQPGFFSTTESIVSSLMGLGGTVVSFLLFAILISITHQREKAIQLARKMTVGLRESELHNRAIVENASDAILSVTSEGRISAANQASHLVFGSHASLKGQDFSQLVVNASLEELADQSLHRNGLEIGVTIQGRRTNGEIFPCRVSVDRVKSNGSIYFVVTVRDQTARVEAATKLAEQNKKLVDASHRAGRAEVATGVLHNVGNVLNSVNVSASLLRQRIEASPVSYLVQASATVENNKDDLGTFFVNDRRGKHFPQLLAQLSLSFQKERNAQLRELESLSDNIDHIKEIVSSQQTSAKRGGFKFQITPEELFEDALRMNDSELRWYSAKIIKDFSAAPVLIVRKHDVIQILVNLIQNAHQAIELAGMVDGEIRLSIRELDRQVAFQVQDTGAGIDPENMCNIFKHGFTTKVDGHGFGLHTCANTAQELGGSLSVESEGLGKGATFTLLLPTDSSKHTTKGHAKDQQANTKTAENGPVGLPGGYSVATDSAPENGPKAAF